jgi:ketosteroid isomerase-like protein
MSEQNIESMRRSLKAFNRGDKAAWLSSSDPDAEMFPAREWPENAPIRGAEAIWDFYVEVVAAWEEGDFEVGDIIESRAKVVANTRHRTRGRASGADLAFSYWLVSTYRGGKAIRTEWFADRAEALEAAGPRD